MNLLYVCYANKGRSPSLEALTKFYLGKEHIRNVNVRSAGVGFERIRQMKRENHPNASRLTRQIMLEYGINIDKHVIKYVGDEKSKKDLILVADSYALEVLVNDFPYYEGKALLAGEYAHSRHKEIFGPHNSARGVIKSDVAGYRMMIHEIDLISKGVVKRLIDEGLAKVD